jgi:hypothetical protein
MLELTLNHVRPRLPRARLQVVGKGSLAYGPLLCAAQQQAH